MSAQAAITPDAPESACDAAVLSVARFRRATDNQPRSQALPWPALRAQLTRHAFRPDKDGPLWSPASYPDGATRANENVLAVCCFVGDVDDGTTPAELLPRWEGLAWALHSTHSSTPDKPKWRVIFPLARPVPADDWGSTFRKLTLALLGEHGDPCCSDPARLYYLPACPPALRAEAFADAQKSALLDPDAFPDPEPEAEAEAAMRHALREKPCLVDGRGEGTGRPGDDYNERGDVLDLLQRYGWQIVHQKPDGKVLLRRPGKTRGWSATFGWAGSRVFYPFTSSAPPFEFRRAYSPFAVYAALEHGGDFSRAAATLGSEGYGEAITDKTDKTAWAGEFAGPAGDSPQEVPFFSAPPRPLSVDLLPVPMLPEDYDPRCTSGLDRRHCRAARSPWSTSPPPRSARWLR